ncbi:regulator [Brevibacillus sp. NRS-1366]|uniref:RCC1 domain-containing protein n=1 Tax=Brevibacillus sp. NRS-1366 TaxID=3233899 RepID=UPI003D1D5062
MKKTRSLFFIITCSLAIGVAVPGCVPSNDTVDSPPNTEHSAFMSATGQTSIPLQFTACRSDSKQANPPGETFAKKWRPLQPELPLEEITAISAGHIFDGAGYGWKPGISYGFTKDGAVWKWGYDQRSVDFPIEMKGLKNVQQISGDYALTSDGQVWKLENGELPEKRKSLESIASIQHLDEMFDTLYVLKRDGTVWKWEDEAGKPEPLSGIANIRRLYASSFSLFLIDYSGKLSYIDGNRGEIKSENIQPIKLSGKVKQFTVGYEDQALIQLESGEVYLFSRDEKQVKRMPLADGAVRMAVGGEETYLIVKTDGSVWGWGKNTDSMLGQNQPENVEKPVPIQGLSDIIDVQAGTDHALALDKRGNVYSWGSNMTGQLGRVPLVFDHWTELGQFTEIEQVVTKLEKPYFVRKDGSVWSMHEDRTAYEIKGPVDIQKLDNLYEFPVTLNRAGQVQLWTKDFTGCQTLQLPFATKDMSSGEGELLVRSEDDRFAVIRFDFPYRGSEDRSIVPEKMEMVEADPAIASQVTNLYASHYSFLVLTKNGEVFHTDRTKEVPFRFTKVAGLAGIQELAPQYYIRYTHDPASVWALDRDGRVSEILIHPGFERSSLSSTRLELHQNVEEGMARISGRLRITKDGQIFEQDWSPFSKEQIPEPVRLVSSSYKYAIEGPGSHYHLLVTKNNKLIFIGYNPFGQSSPIPGKVSSLRQDFPR